MAAKAGWAFAAYHRGHIYALRSRGIDSIFWNGPDWELPWLNESFPTVKKLPPHQTKKGHLAPIATLHVPILKRDANSATIDESIFGTLNPVAFPHKIPFQFPGDGTTRKKITIHGNSQLKHDRLGSHAIPENTTWLTVPNFAFNTYTFASHLHINFPRKYYINDGGSS